MKKFSTKTIVTCSLMLAILIVLSQISLPTPFGVPIVLQNLGVILIGVFLPKYEALLVTCSYLFLGAIGLPVFAGGTAGFTSLISVSGGYLIGYPLAAFLISLFLEKTEKLQTNKKLTLMITTCVTIIFGVLFIDFIPGAIGMHYFGKMPLAIAEKYQFSFIIFDLIKAVSAGIVFTSFPKKLQKN